MAAPYFQRVMADHTVPREAGAIFVRTRPRLAVYSHIVRLSSDQMPPGPIQPLIAETCEKYDEPLEIEKNPTTFDITDTVRVKRWSRLQLMVRVCRPTRRSPRMCGRFSAPDDSRGRPSPRGT